MNKLTCQDIESAVVKHLNPRRNLIVPNVSWAIHWMQGREADLLVVTPSRALWEIEIKTNIADVKRERRKNHRLEPDKRIGRLYYAMPKSLVERALAEIKPWAGVLSVDETTKGVTVARAPTGTRPDYVLPDRTLKRLYELCAMRVWTLKKIVHRLMAENDKLAVTMSQGATEEAKAVSP
jgi:hypothetical protein